MLIQAWNFVWQKGLSLLLLPFVWQCANLEKIVSWPETFATIEINSKILKFSIAWPNVLITLAIIKFAHCYGSSFSPSNINNFCSLYYQYHRAQLLCMYMNLCINETWFPLSMLTGHSFVNSNEVDAVRLIQNLAYFITAP